MHYCEVWLRGVKGIFSWHSEEEIQPGARVVVSFRNKNKTGIILSCSADQPDFQTKPILEIWDACFLSSEYVDIAKQVAQNNAAHLEKVLSLMIPEKFLKQQEPKIKAKKDDYKTRPSFELTELQTQAQDEILASEKPVLLRGVTGSGKTEIYKKIADKILEDETAQVLMLVPEIALTPQLMAEFAGLFGEDLAVWHSKLSEGEKVRAWWRCHTGEARVLIGARSASLVPLKNPKLIILDEEHEWTYKNEFAPRFWAHEVAEIIAEKFDAKLLFASATPRLESFVKCETGEWTQVDLETRVHETQLPEIFLVDLKQEVKKGNGSPISEHLLEKLQEMLAQKKQAMLFLNKRGFSGSTLCRVCGKNFECPNCSHPMKMHKKGALRKFICHVCGHLESFPHACPDCDTTDFQFKGWGTQQVEQYLQEILPGIRTLRADADSITGKHDFDEMMNAFHDYEADVLLGTQMIAKGLDFERVELVGVILADVGLSLPDFRAEERVFQLLTQVSGRAGRRKNRGEIVIQTFNPDEKIFDYVRQHDSLGFLNWQKKLREDSQLPPFSSFAKITFSHTDKAKALEQAQNWYQSIKNKKIFSEIFLAPAFFPRSHNKYHFHVLIKANTSLELIDFFTQSEIPDIAKIDLNPVSLL